MSVRVWLMGRLGNNLFQYAIGRMLAEHLNMQLECISGEPEPFSFGNRPSESDVHCTLADLTEYFPNAPLRIAGRAVHFPVESHLVEPGIAWTGQVLDIGSIMANRQPRQLRLKGYFQRFEYYASHRNYITRWFALKPIETPFSIGPDDVLINIRRGMDYAFHNNTLSMSYYEGVLSRLRRVGRVYVCGTGIDNQVRNRLEKYAPIYYEGTVIEHFAFIARFNRIVLSNSTFAWWASFLSRASEIYAPRSDGGGYGFTGFRNVDLHMREARYIEVAHAQFAKMAPPFRSNVALARKMAADDLRLDLGQSSPEVRRLYRELLRWLAVQQKSLTVGEMYDRCKHIGGWSMIRKLLKMGIVTIAIEYLDPRC